MKCQMNNQKSQSFPNTNLDRLGKTGRYLQLRSFTFFALHALYSGPFWTLLAGGCPKAVILARLPFAVEMWDPNGPNDKYILEEHLWHVASTTSTVASLRVARLAKLPLHDGWH